MEIYNKELFSDYSGEIKLVGITKDKLISIGYDKMNAFVRCFTDDGKFI